MQKVLEILTDEFTRRVAEKRRPSGVYKLKTALKTDLTKEVERTIKIVPEGEVGVGHLDTMARFAANANNELVLNRNCELLGFS